MGERGELFLIDHCRWPKICELGLNAAIAYLIMARGSGPDNCSTAWSANAIEKRTGISRKRAGEAIKQLISRNHLKVVNGMARPQYKIVHASQPRWVFLPNALIDGAATELPPIERLRRRGSIEAVRMLIDSYHMQDLANDDGLDWRLIHQEWERKLITEQGNWSIFGYSRADSKTAKWECPLRFQFGRWNQSSQANESFWRIFQILQECSLIETIPHLVEGKHDGAELIFPLDSTGSDAEARLYEAATCAACGMLEDNTGGYRYELDNHTIALPVSNDFPNATVVGVYRLRYRAKTSLTAAWWSKQTEWGRFAERYEGILTDDQGQKLWA